MTRTAIGLLTTLVTVGFGTAAQAQTEPTAAPEPAATSPTGPPPGEPAPAAATGEQAATAPRSKSWEDIVVVPRKAFLKGGRLELAPFTGITLNDVLIRHYTFGGDLNFYLTDVF